MNEETAKKLLGNKKVVDEINRHRWIESEKAGRDIGFERASSDWLERFSQAWMDYHVPRQRSSSQHPGDPKGAEKENT